MNISNPIYVMEYGKKIAEGQPDEIMASREVQGSLVQRPAGDYPGNTLIGELNGTVTERVRALAEALETAGPVVVSENIYGVKWSKLCLSGGLHGRRRVKPLASQPSGSASGSRRPRDRW